MSPLVVSVCFFLFLFAMLSLIRVLHLLHGLFEHRLDCASRSRGYDPLAHAKPSNSVASAQWDALQGHSTLPRRTMVILGSGGHTAEMLCLLQHVDRQRCAPLVYVRARTDISSEVRVRQMEVSAANNLSSLRPWQLRHPPLSLTSSSPSPFACVSDRPPQRQPLRVSDHPPQSRGGSVVPQQRGHHACVHLPLHSRGLPTPATARTTALHTHSAYPQPPLLPALRSPCTALRALSAAV